MIAAGLTLLGFFALAAAMPRHAPALLGARHARIPGRWMQIGGGLLLLAALAVALRAPDWPVALVSWFGVLPVAAALPLLGLTYDARLARGGAWLGALAVAAGVVW